MTRHIALGLAALLICCAGSVGGPASSEVVAAARPHPSIEAPSHPYQTSALWVWQESVITNAADQATFFAFADTHGVRRVYIESESAVQYDQPALISFLETAANNGMTSELLFGDARWVLPGSGYPHQGYAISLTSKYVAQLLGQMKTGLPVAVHYDVEPYSLAQWETERNRIARDYISLVTRLATAAHRLGLTLSVDVPYWYGTIPVTRGSVTTPMNQLVIDAVDRYVIMDYWDTAARVERQATTDLTYADRTAGKQVVIGVLTTCGQVPQDTSFCNRTSHSGTAWMETVLRNVSRTEAPNASFAGLAIEDYTGFSTLGQ